jgi:hypothetical protein
VPLEKERVRPGALATHASTGTGLRPAEFMLPLSRAHQRVALATPRVR